MFIPSYNRPWRGGMTEGAVYQVGPDDLRRVGNCWANGRLKVGDLLLCVEHAGDCFYNFYLLDVADYANRPGVSLTIVPKKLGAYSLGTEFVTLSREECLKLVEGGTVETSSKPLPLKPAKAEMPDVDWDRELRGMVLDF